MGGFARIVLVLARLLSFLSIDPRKGLSMPKGHASQAAKPTISIVIPALNEAPRIGQAVERARALGTLETIVVDGGSQDGTRDLASAAGAIVLKTRPGRATQQNAGAKAAKGHVLLFLHADCWLAPEGRTQIEAAFEDPRVEWGAFRQQIEAPGWKYRLLERGNGWRLRNRSLPFGDQGIFVRREAFERLGGFPEVRLMEDVLLARGLRARSRAAMLSGPIFVSARRWEKKGALRQTLRNWALLTAHRLGVSPDRLARYY